MKSKAGCLVIVFIFCVFMGVTAISMGIGAAYPPINRVAAPLVCPGGEMEFEQQISRRKNPTGPGKATYISATAYCRDHETEETVELGMFPMALYSGLVYGLALFLLMAIPIAISKRRQLRH